MIEENYKAVIESLPEYVQLVAVSKTKPVEDVQAVYNAGQRIFGENKVQELVEKHAVLPKDIQWHFIGHLQRNKVKFIAPFVSLIHGVDSIRLLEEINKQGAKCERIIPCLLQFHIANETTKFGFSFEEAQTLLESEIFFQMKNIRVAGVMGMATFTDNLEQVHNEFRTLNNYAQIIKSHYFKFNDSFKIISMGMSGDYEIAIEEGSNMVRIGSSIFGKRG